jgi:hypothetical protein
MQKVQTKIADERTWIFERGWRRLLQKVPPVGFHARAGNRYWSIHHPGNYFVLISKHIPIPNHHTEPGPEHTHTEPGPERVIGTWSKMKNNPVGSSVVSGAVARPIRGLCRSGPEGTCWVRSLLYPTCPRGTGSGQRSAKTFLHILTLAVGGGRLP